jgi:hypothetical protein
MRQRTSEAIEAPHHEGVTLTELGQRLVEAGAWMSLIAGSRRGGLESALVVDTRA